jgi:hypothetical protein
VSAALDTARADSDKGARRVVLYLGIKWESLKEEVVRQLAVAVLNQQAPGQGEAVDQELEREAVSL